MNGGTTGGGVGAGNGNGVLQQQSSTTKPWIKQFCQAQPVLVEIDRLFIEDAFNLYGLKSLVSDFGIAMSIILDKKPTENSRELLQSAMLLYGLIHARFICTTRGLELMRRKYLDFQFGVCTRYLCRSHPVVPIGIIDQPNLETIKYYCPCCQDVYCYPLSSQKFSVDSAYIGPHFPHIFFMTYENLVPINGSGVYSPRLFGFKVHPSSHSLCQKGSKRVLIETSGATSSSPSETIPHYNGRRSSLPFLDLENEDQSDGEYGPLPPPPRLFSPVNSAISAISNYSPSSSNYYTYSQRSPHLSHESSAEYSIRGTKRDSSGHELSTTQESGSVLLNSSASAPIYHPLPPHPSPSPLPLSPPSSSQQPYPLRQKRK